MKPVNLKELTDAFQGISDDDTYRSFVDKRDGQIYSFEARHLAIAGFYLDGDDYEVYPAEQSEIDKAREFTDRYDREFVIDFPDEYEMRDYDIMEEYAESQPDARIANQLLYAIRGKGAFRKFREAVTRFGFLDDWYAFKDSAMIERARRWCIRNGIDYKPKIAVIAGYEIRPATREDLPGINRVYAAAREYMERSGNQTQWSGGYPWPDLLTGDIEKRQLFVMSANGKICGVFAFIIGIDPTYARIENGAWLNDEPYGAIHRIASDGKRRGIFKACLEFCLEHTDNIRIDTHVDNMKMQATLVDNGFVKCGTIYVHDGVSEHSPRIAYQYAQ